MKPFTRYELLGIIIILGCVGTFFGQGIYMSLLRARDAQRMGDLSTISDAVTNFHEEYGFFPPADNGKIIACKSDTYESVIATLQKMPKFDRGIFMGGLRTCVWGDDSMVTMSDHPVKLPRDPKTSDGFLYTYLSNDNRFQILAHLESKEDFYDPTVDKRAISCGSVTCNVGKAYGSTPLDRSIEEYESELQKNTSGK